MGWKKCRVVLVLVAFAVASIFLNTDSDTVDDGEGLFFD